MGRDSKIEWTTHTFNPWIGCTKVSPGCAHCYAEARMDHRFGQVKWGPSQPRRRTSAANWRLPVRWNKEAAGAAERPRVFCASLADVFDSEGPADARADLFALIEATPNLDWLLLTKRPENILAMVPESWRTAWPVHAWIGTTVEDQKRADERIPHLLTIPARVRFLSCEPLLGAVDLLTAAFIGAGSFGAMEGIQWVIAGGESGTDARPMHPAWARDLRDQCARAGVPYLFKQWGEWAPLNDGPGADLDMGRYGRPATSTGFFDYCDRWNGPGVPQGERIGDLGPNERMRANSFRQTMGHVGKHAAGRLLDGVQHDGYPSP